MSAQDLTDEFMAAYNEPVWVYGRIADEVLYIMGNAKTCNINAYEYLDLDVDSREVWIVNNVLPVLQFKGWPKHGSKDFHLSVQDVCHNVLFPSDKV